MDDAEADVDARVEVRVPLADCAELDDAAGEAEEEEVVLELVLEELASSFVVTPTLKFVITRSAEPVNGSVPLWMACRYCVFATPCSLIRYSAPA